MLQKKSQLTHDELLFLSHKQGITSELIQVANRFCRTKIDKNLYSE